MARANRSGSPASAIQSDRLSELSRIDFEPAMTLDEVESCEDEYNKLWGVRRRLMLLWLTQSRDQIVKAFLDKETSGVMIEALDEIEAYRDHLKSGLEIADAVIGRLIAAGFAATDTQKKLTRAKVKPASRPLRRQAGRNLG